MATKSFVIKPDNSILRKGKLAMANAKINLSIDVLGVRESDGYHLVRMIMQQIPLYDRLFFFLGEDGNLYPNPHRSIIISPWHATCESSL